LSNSIAQRPSILELILALMIVTDRDLNCALGEYSIARTPGDPGDIAIIWNATPAADQKRWAETCS